MKKDIKFKINMELWQKAKEKLKKDFPSIFAEHCMDTDCTLVLLMLLLISEEKIYPDTVLLHTDLGSNPEHSKHCKTIEVHNALKDKLSQIYKNSNPSQLLELAILSYLEMNLDNYMSRIYPLYTIIGYKNTDMQQATATAIKNMNLHTEQMTFVDACCATGSLFFGTYNHPWKKVILNDLNPLRTNFLNVLLKKPLELIKGILSIDFSFINAPDTMNPQRRIYKEATETYRDNRRNYHKVDCNVEIAVYTFILQCIDKKFIEQSDKIFRRLGGFLPAHAKLVTSNATITQEDCLSHLENEENKLVLLDVPYIGSEKECGIKDYDYNSFHHKVSAKLEKAKYPFIYYCRSSAPKSDKRYNTVQAHEIIKKKLGLFFFNKGYHFEQVQLEQDTELMISNQHYSPDRQIQWTPETTDLLFPKAEVSPVTVTNE